MSALCYPLELSLILQSGGLDLEMVKRAQILRSLKKHRKIALQGTPYWHLNHILDFSISNFLKCAWNRACCLLHIWMRCLKGNYVGRGRILLRKLRTLILDFLPFSGTRILVRTHTLHGVDSGQLQQKKVKNTLRNTHFYKIIYSVLKKICIFDKLIRKMFGILCG